MDRNHIVLSGSFTGATQRPVGQQGRSLVEARLRIAKPARRGEAEAHEVVPVTVWDATLGAALLELDAGTPCVVLGRISAREWQAPGGQTKIFLEVVAESITVDATMVASGEPAATTAPTPARPEPPPVSRVESRPVTRSGGSGRGRSESDVPF